MSSADARRSGSKVLLAAAAVLLAVPIVALLWVQSYARVEPRLAGFPFFIWYQFAWVFLCATCTFAAYQVVLLARAPAEKRGGTRRETSR